MTFDDQTIRQLFGFEDAESESPERLKEYFLKKDTYDSVMAELPLRILVGHKGTGKSALFRIALADEFERGNLAILIKPDDIAEIAIEQQNFLVRVRQWKDGLLNIIGEKVIDEFGADVKSCGNFIVRKGVKLISFLREVSDSIAKEINLSDIQKRTVDNFTKTNRVVVYLDDLDRGWEGKKDDVTRISALLNAIRDLSNDNPGLIFKVALRSDVYYLVRTSDESTDKIEGAVVWCQWTNHEILAMLIKRILTYNKKPQDEKSLLKFRQAELSQYLNGVFAKRFEGKGKWSDIATYKVLMSMIRKRPRDLVKLCSLAAQLAYQDKSELIETRHLQGIFEQYSQGRIQDTINEYKSELPNIESLLLGMKPSTKEKQSEKGFIYSTPELKNKLRSIMQHNHYSLGGKPATVDALLNFLYKINFITARKRQEDGLIQRRYFEENRYLSTSSVDFGYDWEVHPAFRWGLQPDNIDLIFRRFEEYLDEAN